MPPKKPPALKQARKNHSRAMSTLKAAKTAARKCDVAVNRASEKAKRTHAALDRARAKK